MSTMTKKMVLWAEDDPEDQLLLQEAIEDAQCTNEFHFVDDGEGVVEYLAANAPPALIMLDLNMPRKNGLETLQEIKETPEWANIPVIIFTTSQADSDMMTSYDLGVNSFMTKPTTFDGLIEVLRYIETSQFFYM